jgi:hypothetical protein
MRLGISVYLLDPTTSDSCPTGDALPPLCVWPLCGTLCFDISTARSVGVIP